MVRPKFCIPPRVVAAPPPPQWLRALSDPPPRLHEEDWPIIEHIRMTGQIGSGAMTSLFNSNPWDPDGPPPLDKNAPERLQSLRDIAAREASMREFMNSPEQKRKRRLEREKRERERAELEAERQRQQAEFEQRLHNRAEEQTRRDVEWGRAAPPPRYGGDPFVDARKLGPGRALAYGSSIYVKEEDEHLLTAEQRSFLFEQERRNGVIRYGGGMHVQVV